MSKHQITESFEIAGEWFLPNGEQQISGTLSWEIKSAFLNLNDTFNPRSGPIHAEDCTTYPVIHGVTTKSQHFSILHAMTANTSVSFGQAGFRQQDKLLSSQVVCGAYVNDETLYRDIRVRIPGLHLWLSKASIRTSSTPPTDNQRGKTIYIADLLPVEEFYVPSIDATLGWGIETCHSGDGISEISVTSSASLRISPAEPKNMEWFIVQLGKATTLLSFLAGSGMSADYFQATLTDANTVDVLMVLGNQNYCPYKHLRDFYMLRSEMGVDFADAFNKWFDIYDKIAMPSQLALSILSSEKLWVHVEFLSFMQAFEGFHRAISPGLYTSADEYKAIGNALVNAIPNEVTPDHRDSLKARIKFGNEISLRRRLKSLVERLDISVRGLILRGDGAVPKSWPDTRNYYTHWDEASRQNVLDSQKMRDAIVRMRHLIRVLYFDLVGIPCAAIVKTLCNGSYESQYLIHLNNREYRAEHPDFTGGAMMTIYETKANTPPDTE